MKKVGVWVVRLLLLLLLLLLALALGPELELVHAQGAAAEDCLTMTPYHAVEVIRLSHSMLAARYMVPAPTLVVAIDGALGGAASHVRCLPTAIRNPVERSEQVPQLATGCPHQRLPSSRARWKGCLLLRPRLVRRDVATCTRASVYMLCHPD